MNLEICNYEVRNARFGDETGYADGLLTINRRELIDHLSTDPALRDVDVMIAQPGERTRIVNILEAVAARIKPDYGDYYPGLLGGLRKAGEGKTHVLKGLAVLEIGFMTGFFGALLDMAGPCSLLTPYSKTINICVSAMPETCVGLVEYGMALKFAGMKTAVYLAGTTLGMRPDEVQDYGLERKAGDLAGLPRVAYLYQIHNHGEAREPFLYGNKSDNFYPTILHPNEILDGAIVSFHYNISSAIKNATYTIVNHPVILDLYSRHGKELNFAGVVIAPEPPSLAEKKRTAIMSAGLLKDVLKAEGVIISKEGGGHTDVDIMQNCEECERLGIKTVLIDNVWLGPDGTGELPLISISQTADAMVSVGNFEEVIQLPAMETVVGGDRIPDVTGDLRDRLTIPVSLIPAGISQVGFTFLGTEVW